MFSWLRAGASRCIFAGAPRCTLTHPRLCFSLPQVEYDAQMKRTVKRMLPSGRISLPHALAFGITTGAVGALLGRCAVYVCPLWRAIALLVALAQASAQIGFFFTRGPRAGA